MKRPVALIVLTLLGLSMPAATVAAAGRETVDFVPMDSVMVWPHYDHNRLRRAFEGDTTRHLQRFSATPLGRKELRQLWQAWQRRANDSLNLTGGTGNEANGPLQALTGCATVRLAARIFPHRPDSRLMDAVEAALLSGIDAALTGFFAPAVTHEAARTAWAAYGLRYATDEQGIWVNLFGNSTAIVSTPHFRYTIDQITAMPYRGRVTLRLTHHRGAKHLLLRIRIPAWCGGTATRGSRYVDSIRPLPRLYVNGHSYDYAIEAGYALIDRSWNTGDEVYWDFDLTPRRVRRASSPDSAAICMGPLVFAAAAPPEPGQTLAPTPLQPNEAASFLRLRGRWLTPGGQPAPLLLLPYAESFTWQGRTPVWLPVARP